MKIEKGKSLSAIWATFHIKLREDLQNLATSIAFYPAAIGLACLILSYLSIRFDFSESGKQIKSSLHWLSLRDATTARSIISSIVSGLISLTVFSFSMVMIVLNQAASQMSNRVLDKLIGNRFQQIVLGIYIGTIVYALFLLSTIRDIDSGIYIPALSTYLLIVLTVLDIFLFIYFLHYITQSVKYNVIIQRIYSATKTSMLKACCLQDTPPVEARMPQEFIIVAPASGIFEGINKAPMLALSKAQDCTFHILRVQGDFVLSGQPLMAASKRLDDEIQRHAAELITIHESESIEGNFFYGFKQLMEIAVKALSPGINDPNTAVISLRALFRLYAHRARYYPEQIITDDDGITRLIMNGLSFDRIFSETLLPIWDYGKKDRIIRSELGQLLVQLHSATSLAVVGRLLREVEKAADDDDR